MTSTLGAQIMKIKRLLEKLCVLTFTITALTSIPLFFNYIKGASPKFQLITDLHVWFGLAFILFVSIRIFRNRHFVRTMVKGGEKNENI